MGKDSKTALVADVDCTAGGQSLCNDAKKADIEKFSKMSSSELEAAISEKTQAMEKLEKDFKEFVDGLQKSYTEANEKKDKDVEAIKNSGLGLMKAVAAHNKAAKSEL